MDARALEMLVRIGKGLDAHVFPRVTNGGFVVLNDSAVPSTERMETNHGKWKERRPAAGSWQRSPGRKGSSGGSRPSGDPSPVIGSDPEARYKAALDELQWQYPGVQCSHQREGIWLLTKSRLLPNLRQHAIFFTGISFPTCSVRAWAFWGDPIAYPEWIGPRHTNFPDGSICAYEPMDSTWTFGDPLVELLDLYTVWAVRHLYLRQFGRWPGHQSIHFPGERILELRADEYCGCANSQKLYGNCCMPGDLAGNRIGACLDFYWRTGLLRRPPEPVVNYLRSGKVLPSIVQLQS